MGLVDWLLKLLGVTPEELERARRGDATSPGARPGSGASAAPGRAPSPGAPAGKSGGKTLDLDPGPFAPISDAELRRQASQLGRRFDPLFGRRDLIPPMDDPRTALIERGMVTHGFATPEQLAEIHQIGRQMDEVRPDLAIAYRDIDRRIELTQKERAEEKERKKKESAAKRAQHAAQVAERRANDIIHLGPGVSGGLADRRSNVELLTKRGVPVLATPADVAQALGLTVPRLRWLAYHSTAPSRSHYIRFTVPKKSGGLRELMRPHRQLAACQQWLLRHVLDGLPAHAAAHGFVRERSTVTNAAPHVGRAIVLNMDLKDFFPSISFPRVRGAFERIGYSPAASTVFALLATEPPRRTVIYAGKTLHVQTGPRGLPQGASTSPAISNLIARKLDARLTGIAKKLGFTYTRYADDLTFSSGPEGEKLLGYLMARVRHIAQDEGFAVNEKKTRVLRRNASQRVTGIVVNERPGVPRKTVRRLRAILHRAKKEGLAAQNRENRPNFTLWVKGMVAYVRMVNPKQAAPLERELEAVLAVR